MKKTVLMGHSDLQVAVDQFNEKMDKWESVRNGVLFANTQTVDAKFEPVITARRNMVTGTLLKEGASSIVKDFHNYSLHQIDDDVALRLAYGNVAIRIVKHYGELMADYNVWAHTDKKKNLPEMLTSKSLFESQARVRQLEGEIQVLKDVLKVYSDTDKKRARSA